MSKIKKNRERLLFATLLVVGIFVLVVVGMLHINQGSMGVSPEVILDGILKPQNIIEHNIIRDVRLPRLVIGLIAGGALSISGVILQSLMKNPLASASTLGVNAGAYFCVILFSIFFRDVQVIPFFPALLGALLTAFIVINLGGPSKSNPVQMTLAGVALTLVFGSMTSALQILFENETKGLFLWGSGSLIQTSWQGINFVLPIIITCLTLSLLIGTKLDILALGDEMATSLGLNIRVYRYLGLAIGVVATAATIAVVGPIGFIGLVAPHIVKKIGFKKHRDILLLSFVFGSIILLGADVLSRFYTKGSYELPVGAFTAIIGAPWLIYLAYKTSNNMTKSSYGLLIQTSKRKIPYSILVGILFLITSIVFLIALVYRGQGPQLSDFIIKTIRLPRIMTALLAGIILGVSGFLLQTVLNNTLADPSTLGITPGAALGALFAIQFIPETSSFLISLSGFVGAMISAGIIFIVSKKSKYNASMLVLVGMAVTAICNAGVNIIIINTSVGKSASLVWLAGSTYGSNWNNVMTLLIIIALMTPVVWFLSKDLDAMMLGEDIATAIGSNVTKMRLITSIVGIILASIAVSIVGTVGFIGLLAPHMSRFLVGVKHRKNIIVTALLGGLLLLFADFIGRVVIYPNEIPSGLVVSIIGAPYFLWLLHSTSKIKR